MAYPQPIEIRDTKDKIAFMRNLEEKDSLEAIKMGVSENTAKGMTPTQNVYMLSALSTSKAQHAKSKEIQEGVSWLNDKIQDFLKKKGLTTTLYNYAKADNDSAIKESADSAKKNAEELFDVLFDDEIIKKWLVFEGEEVAKSAIATYGKNGSAGTIEERDALRENVIAGRTRLRKQEFVDMLAEASNVGKENENLQRYLGAIADSISKISITQKNVIEAIFNEDPLAKDKDLEGILNPYFAPKHMLPTELFDRKDMVNMLQRTLLHKTHDIGIKYGHGLAPIKERKYLDEELNAVDVDKTFGMLVTDDVLKGPRDALVMQYAKLSNYSVTMKGREEIEAEQKFYSGIIKDYLKKNGLDKSLTEDKKPIVLPDGTKKENTKNAKDMAKELELDILMAWAKRRWTTIGAADKADTVKELAKKDRYFSDALHRIYIGYEKSQITDAFAKSKDLVEDTEELLGRFSASSAKYSINKSRLTRKILKDATETSDSKYSELEKAVSPFATSGGYAIKPKILSGRELLGMTEEYTQMRTYDPKHDFPQLRPVKQSPLVDSKGKNYTS